MKKILLVGLLSIVILTTGVVSVSALSNPKTKAEILSDLTGKTVEEINYERTNAKTYGEVANNNGVLEEFKRENLENTKAILDEKVTNGTLTQEEANEIISNMEERQANCNGTGNGTGGQGLHNGSGAGQGNGKGMGQYRENHRN